MSSETITSTQVIQAAAKLYSIVEVVQRLQTTLIQGFKVRISNRPMEFNIQTSFYGPGYQMNAAHAQLQTQLSIDHADVFTFLLGLHRQLSKKVEGATGAREFQYGFLSQLQAGYGLHKLKIWRSVVDVCTLDKQFYEVELLHDDDWRLILRAERVGEHWDEFVRVECV